MKTLSLLLILTILSLATFAQNEKCLAFSTDVVKDIKSKILSQGVDFNDVYFVKAEIPSIYDGSYYITIRHRNSLETTTNAPVAFTGSTLTRSFGNTSFVYGGNLGTSYDNHRVIYAGDVNQDGYIDTQDYIGVDNDSYNYVFGYVITDVDGSGLVDTNDYIFIDNNNYNYIGTMHPF